jgi:hypothetical protein
MPETSLAHESTRPSRILVDLAEGRLDHLELDAMVTWISANAPQALPERLVELGVCAPHSVAVAYVGGAGSNNGSTGRRRVAGGGR